MTLDTKTLTLRGIVAAVIAAAALPTGWAVALGDANSRNPILR